MKTPPRIHGREYIGHVRRIGKLNGTKCRAPCSPPCRRVAEKNGLCHWHSVHVEMGGDVRDRAPALSRGRPRKEPSHCVAPCAPPCMAEPVAHGLCMSHYVRMRRGGDLTLPVSRRPERGG